METVRDGDFVRLTVADTGVGIAADFLPYVFEPFRRSGALVDGHVEGLGLGLAIVRHLVELHGGSVTASSDGVGHGASFVVRLPSVASCVVGSRLKFVPLYDDRDMLRSMLSTMKMLLFTKSA